MVLAASFICVLELRSGPIKHQCCALCVCAVPARFPSLAQALLDNLFGWSKSSAFQEDYPAVIRLSETGSRCYYHPETTATEVCSGA